MLLECPNYQNLTVTRELNKCRHSRCTGGAPELSMYRRAVTGQRLACPLGWMDYFGFAQWSYVTFCIMHMHINICSIWLDFIFFTPK